MLLTKLTSTLAISYLSTVLHLNSELSDSPPETQIALHGD